MGKTRIEWTQATWNPVTGCSRVSPGCVHCYAARMAKRLAGRFGYPEAPHEFDVTLHQDRLSEPLKWRSPQRVFVVSMGDLFHEDVPEEYIDAVFAVMAVAKQHTFQVLTKRPERMYDWYRTLYTRSLRYPALGKRSVPYTYGQIGEMLRAHALEYGVQVGAINRFFPLANVWLGVTAENQMQADKRIPVLLQTPAVVRFVSVEPILRRVDLTDFLQGGARLHWVICGGETGPGARPMHPDWARTLRDQCQAAQVPFFFKQWGEWVALDQSPDCATLRENGINPGFHVFDCEIYEQQRNAGVVFIDRNRCTCKTVYKFGKHAAGRLLDGRIWEEVPATSDRVVLSASNMQTEVETC